MLDKYAQRVKRCSNLMKDAGLDVLLLTKPANMFYLTGDGRLCAFAMVTQNGETALGVPMTDIKDAQDTAVIDKVVGFPDEVGMIHAIAHFFEEFSITSGRVGLEFTFLTESMKRMLTHPHAKPEAVETADATPIISKLRLVKDKSEIAKIRRAAQIAVIGMEAAMKTVAVGTTESAIAAAAESAMRNAGAEGFWRTYVASGPRTNLAHGLPTLRLVQEDELVMIDIHPIVDGYSADICRTVCSGSSQQEQIHAHDAFVKAQQETIAMAKAGAGINDLERHIHEILEEAGFGGAIFGPPIHGVGIEFEEAPLPAGHAFFHGEKEAPPLAQDCVIAVGNCGLYTGPWGVRVEDTVLITPERGEVLTDFKRGLEV